MFIDVSQDHPNYDNAIACINVLKAHGYCNNSTSPLCVVCYKNYFCFALIWINPFTARVSLEKDQ